MQFENFEDNKEANDNFVYPHCSQCFCKNVCKTYQKLCHKLYSNKEFEREFNFWRNENAECCKNYLSQYDAEQYERLVKEMKEEQ